MKIQIGDRFTTNFGDIVEVLSIEENRKKVKVLFLDEHRLEATVLGSNLKRGQVRNPKHSSNPEVLAKLGLPSNIKKFPSGNEFCFSDYDYTRFTAFVKISDSGCWEWQGSKVRGDYGNFGAWSVTKNRYHMTRAHIWSYVFHKGEAPNGSVIMHKCDNPSCVNPEHLEYGSYKDNSQDAISKGRNAKGSNVVSKALKETGRPLSEDTVKEIWKLSKTGINQREIANKLDIHFVNVCRVLKRQTWAWVEIEE